MSNINKNLTKFLLLLLFNLFFSCTQNSEITILFENWIKVEQSITEENSANFNTSFSNFCTSYYDFKNSDICKNLISIHEPKSLEEKNIVLEIMKNLETGINEENLSQIRIAVFQIEELDKNSTFNSNQNYILLNILLIILCILITLGLFIYIKKYEKKQNEAKQIGVYSHLMIKGIETEKNRVSKEIHDTVLQDIKALNLTSELFISSPATQEEISKNEELKASLTQETQNCVKKLRNICNNLTPSEFKNQTNDNNGFILALRNLTKQFAEKNKIPCVLKIQDNLDISSLSIYKITDIFRIIQEALNNIEKHAQANKVSVVIISNKTDETKKSLKIFITDDGKGFDANKTDHSVKQHFGLSNMKDRAKNLSANFNIISEPGEGTEITLEVPF